MQSLLPRVYLSLLQKLITMKKTNILILIALVSIITTVALAQTNATNNITKYQYCQLVKERAWNSYTGGNTTTTGKIYHPDGKEEEFKGNFTTGLTQLGNQGWELVSTHIEEGDGWRNTYFIFKKKI